jgi:hypothetical protein
MSSCTYSITAGRKKEEVEEVEGEKEEEGGEDGEEKFFERKGRGQEGHMRRIFTTDLVSAAAAR